MRRFGTRVKFTAVAFMVLLSQENRHMLSEIVLGLLDSAERLCLRVVRIVFGTEGLCVRTVRGLVFTPVR